MEKCFQGSETKWIVKSCTNRPLRRIEDVRDFLGIGVGYLASVKAWTGAEGGPQDFQIDGIATEVKTLVQAEPQRFKISSARQLDETFFNALLIAHHKAHRQKDSGQTLPEIVSEIRENISDDIAALEQFEDKLVLAKYLDSDAGIYEEYGYGIVKRAITGFVRAFQRLRRASFPSG